MINTSHNVNNRLADSYFSNRQKINIAGNYNKNSIGMSDKQAIEKIKQKNKVILAGQNAQGKDKTVQKDKFKKG